MILTSLTQSELDRSVNLLISNGPLPHVQEVIGPVGFGPEGLQRLADLLYGWRANQTSTQMLLLTQKQAGQERDELRREVEQTVSAFKRIVRALFDDDESVLRFLGMRPRRASRNGRSENGIAEEEGDNTPTPSRRPSESQSLAACVARWRTLFANAQQLAENYRQPLAEVGWSAERLAEAAALVETLAAADSKQEEAMAARREQQAVTKQSEHALRDDYKEARELIRVALYEAELENKDQFKELIGLTL